jgi:hypothetical protein
MVTKCNFDYFRKLDGKITRYSDYLELKGSILFSAIQDCRETPKMEDRRLKITKYINDIVENVFIYLDKEEFQFIFQNIPTVSLAAQENSAPALVILKLVRLPVSVSKSGAVITICFNSLDCTSAISSVQAIKANKIYQI